MHEQPSKPLSVTDVIALTEEHPSVASKILSFYGALIIVQGHAASRRDHWDSVEQLEADNYIGLNLITVTEVLEYIRARSAECASVLEEQLTLVLKLLVTKESTPQEMRTYLWGVFQALAESLD